MKNRIMRSVICLIVLWLAACSSLFPTPIAKLLEDPRSFEGKQVQVSGVVVESISILVLKYFVVQDDTGEITVITQRPLPRKGEKVKVYGKIQEAFSLGDQQLIVLSEDPGKQ
ncbi:MAG: hypothetical protein KKC76_15705 [Proteobacteria bacterium]|nr:hypothetical protein [Pseudomonadota bacterium]MBU4294554.1 hypothetical protein [Pseudomonadota bacterium]MCG2747090.1 hypothetical protein [Desulfobulbaceae bacterium]